MVRSRGGDASELGQRTGGPSSDRLQPMGRVSSSGGLLIRPFAFSGAVVVRRPCESAQRKIGPSRAPCHDLRVQITKTSTADGFVVVDLPGAATATGIVRCARKILQDGAVNLARSLTYTYASFGLPISGASAGINADGDGRDAAVAAFVDELSPRVTDGSLVLAAGKGVSSADLAAWALPPLLGHETLAAGVVAAARAGCGDLAGSTVAVEESSPGSAAVVAAFTAAGADAVSLPLTELLVSGRSVVVVGSKPGVLDHENVESLGAATIIGAAGLSITARGLAVARRNGANVLPDFVAAAGPVLAAAGHADGPSRISAVIEAVLPHDEGPYLGACYAAEEFLRTWSDELPFGRPLA